MDAPGLSIQTSAADPTGSGANRDFQVIKCVVVGDTGVGKTRLICSRACGTKYTLQQLMTTHVPTVWAIDHYRKNRDILNRSWCTVDGLNISLHLWDTFGYHDKDRRFAYGRADVILVCFSAVRPRSLRSVFHHWYPEIQRLCPETPIVVCATQVDLRFLYQDPEFIKLDKGPFFKEIKESDILPPDRGRAVAQEIKAHYYESSVCLNYGINDVFTNVIRAALIHKRDKHFWNQLGGLKRISRPICQAPYQPPKPLCPKMVVQPPTLDQDLLDMLDSQSYADVVFMVQGTPIPAHRGCLAVSSAVFEEFFLSLNSDNASTWNSLSSDTAFAPVLTDSPIHTTLDTVNLLDNEELRSSSEVLINTMAESICRSQRFSFCASVKQNCCWESIGLAGMNSAEDSPLTVITVCDSISIEVFCLLLQYLYSEQTVGQMESQLPDQRLVELCRVAELIGIPDLASILMNILNKESFLNKSILSSVQFQRCQRRRELLVKKSLFADVTFQLEDGCIRAHKALLVSSCDVMAGMFSFNFRECSAKTIPLPGVTRESFVALQDYLYSGQCPVLSTIDCLDLIELANRMCLPRLVSLAEQFVVNELIAAEDSGKDITEDVLLFIEPAQLHNAGQLAAWCLWNISSRYMEVYHSHTKLLQTLLPDNQVYLSKHRWPPLWYLREADYYEKCLLELERQHQKHVKSYLRRSSEDFDGGCLGFCGRKNRKLKCETNPTTTVVN